MALKNWAEIWANIWGNIWAIDEIATPGTANTKEWWLDLRPAVFPEESNWYGPHTGDAIMQYRIFNGVLVGAQHGTMNMWKLDQEGFFGSMLSPTGSRESVAISARLQAPGMKDSMIDAYGFTAEMAETTAVDMEVDIDRGLAQEDNIWTSPASLPEGGGVYSVVRPIKRPGHDAQITLTHSAESDIEIHSLYIRERSRRKQSEKQEGSAQT